MNRSARAYVPVLVLGWFGCGSKAPDKVVDPPARHDAGGAAHAESDGGMPALAPAPPVPAVPAGLPSAPDHPDVTPNAVALGELLFFDPRLSSTGKMSCATCHDPAAGFSAPTGTPRQATATAKPNLRRAPALVNLAWVKELGWDGRYGSLAEQLPAHVRGQLGDELASGVTRLGALPLYRAQFTRAGGQTPEVAVTALSAYVLTRYAGDAPWDRVERSPDAPADIKAGYQLFAAKAQCAVCHTPPLYTDLRYHRLGLVAVNDDGAGRVDPALRGAFRTPTLRGAAARGAFFHDGSRAKLEEAIDYHLEGGTGQGADPSIVDPALKKVALTSTERSQLIAFVRALTSDATAPKPPTLP